MRQFSSSLPNLPPVLDHHDLGLLEQGRHPDPFAVLGRQSFAGGSFVRAYLPGCSYAELVTRKGDVRTAVPMTTQGDGIFQAPAPEACAFRLRISWPDGIVEIADPYAFGLLLSEQDIYFSAEGRHFDLPTRLGANPRTFDGVDSVLFAV